MQTDCLSQRDCLSQQVERGPVMQTDCLSPVAAGRARACDADRLPVACHSRSSEASYQPHLQCGDCLCCRPSACAADGTDCLSQQASSEASYQPHLQCGDCLCYLHVLHTDCPSQQVE